MSTSLLYHTCGIRGYEYRSTEFVCGTTFVHIGQAREKLRCPCVEERKFPPGGAISGFFRSVPIGSNPVSIVLDVARVYCPKCDATRQVQVGFADEYRRHTRAFAALRCGVDGDGDDPGRGQPPGRGMGSDQGVEEERLGRDAIGNRSFVA